MDGRVVLHRIANQNDLGTNYTNNLHALRLLKFSLTCIVSFQISCQTGLQPSFLFSQAFKMEINDDTIAYENELDLVQIHTSTDVYNLNDKLYNHNHDIIK
jgi:hypothetical protein